MKQDLRAIVARAAVEREVDVLLLAECVILDDEMAQALIEATGRTFFAIAEAGDKVRLFSVYEPERWTMRYAQPNGRLTIWSLDAIENRAILVVSAHLTSKMNAKPSSQASEAAVMAKEIIRAESTSNHERTLVVGDLNMNPFDDGITDANAFHAVMTRRIAARERRKVQGELLWFLL